MKRKLLIALASIFLANTFSYAQVNTRVISPAVPYLLISPDSRAAALGDAGVASSPDANSMFWNTGKLAFINKEFGTTVSYTPWLRDLVDDMGLLHAAGYKKVSKNSALGLSMTYFNQGEIQFTTNTGQSNGTFQSREFNITGGYGTKLGRNFSMGLNLKYIHSNLIGNQVVSGSASKPANTVASDISLYYTKATARVKELERGLSYSGGLTISNIGGKVNYGRSQFFLPTNMKLGGGLNYKIDSHNQFNLLVDFNKLLVPTPPLVDASGNIVKGNNPSTTGSIAGIFSSFTDAPDGFKEELREITASYGLEYMYNDLFAVRGGYFMESNWKGGRKYVTTGLGFRLSNYQIDLAYLIPTSQGSPLSNTWRISLIFDLNGKRNIDTSDDEDVKIEK